MILKNPSIVKFGRIGQSLKNHRGNTDTACGGTPLFQLSIEKHAKPTLGDCNFSPHVTLPWKFCSQKLSEWNFILSFILWCRLSLLFKIQACEQGHRFSALICRSLHQKWLGPEFTCLQSEMHIQILTFWEYLHIDHVIVFQIYDKVTSFTKIKFPKDCNLSHACIWFWEGLSTITSNVEGFGGVPSHLSPTQSWIV